VNTLNGLPVHVLLVHAVVVLLPLSALLLILTAVSPTIRHRLAGANALLALAVVALVPLTTSAGEWLEHHVASTPDIRRHTELGDTAIWAAIPVALVALVIWWRQRETRPATQRRTWLHPTSRTATRLIAVVAVVVAGIAVVDVYKIGDSGAKASWEGKVSSAPLIAG